MNAPPRMTPLDFGYWLHGLAGVSSPEEFGQMALAKATSMLSAQLANPAPARLPAMKALRVPAFCVHNIAAVESCAACGQGLRLYGLRLPPGCANVYIPAANTGVDDVERIRDTPRHRDPGK
jgi:hypothetical protein